MSDIDTLLASIDSGFADVPLDDDGLTIAVRPVSILECLRLVNRFPALKSALFPRAGAEADDFALIDILLGDAPEAIGAVLAVAVGRAGDRGIEARLAGLPDDYLLKLLNAVIERTMPDGVEAFFGKLLALAGAAGLQSQPRVA